MPRDLLLALVQIVRVACGLVTLAGLGGLPVILAVDELPALLPAVVFFAAPDLRLEVGAARLDGLDGLEMRDVRLANARTGEPILRATRVGVRGSPMALAAGRIDELRLDGAVVTPFALPVSGDAGGASWVIGRLVARHARLRLPPADGRPGLSARLLLDLRELGTTPEALERTHVVVVKDVVVGGERDVPLLRIPGATITGSLASLRERRQLDAIALRGPRLALAGPLPAVGGTDAGGPGWVLGRLVIRGGAVTVPATATTPGVAFRLAGDWRELGTDPARAALPRRATAHGLTVTAPGGATILAADAVRAHFSIAGLDARRVDEILVMAPAVTVPQSMPAMGDAAAPAAGPAWSVGRFTVHEGTIAMAPAGDMPGVRGAFALDMRELGFDATRADRPHQIVVRDVRLRYPRQPASMVVDVGSLGFTLAGLRRQRLDHVDVARGLVVLDRALRERMSGDGGRSVRAARRGAWSVGVLNLGQLGLRLTELGPEIPDVTLMVRSRLTDVPFDPAALATAQSVQHVELSSLTLDSPLDPFRPVVHVGSIFAQFTIAGLLERRIDRLVVVSPTIYLGEDLIWYMSATRGEAAAQPAAQPWTVRRLRAELGRIVITFRGVDRIGLPLTFRTDAHDVVLGDLASLRLAAALTVPRQDYRLPGFDLELRGIEGELRFDFPPGQARDNVVNTLSVDVIRWRDYHITGGWLAATFDQQGINGTLGGRAYDGFVDGGASIPFGPGPMAGWASCTDLDLAPLAATVAGASLEMEGLVDVEAAVQATGTRLDTARADLVFSRPGVLRFPSLDRLLARLPAGASSWQRDLARIAVETFSEYPYTTGQGWMRYVHRRGELHLGLDGGRGKRHFDVYYTGDPTALAGGRQEVERR